MTQAASPAGKVCQWCVLKKWISRLCELFDEWPCTNDSKGIGLGVMLYGVYVCVGVSTFFLLSVLCVCVCYNLFVHWEWFHCLHLPLEGEPSCLFMGVKECTH